MGVQTTINELVERLLALTGSDLRPEYLPQEQMFVTNRIGSTELAEQLTGFRAAIDLDDGLGSVIEWRQQDKLSGAKAS
jgi:nucleoside-diphosphate-sugar epimerase